MIVDLLQKIKQKKLCVWWDICLNWKNTPNFMFILLITSEWY